MPSKFDQIGGALVECNRCKISIPYTASKYDIAWRTVCLECKIEIDNNRMNNTPISIYDKRWRA